MYLFFGGASSGGIEAEDVFCNGVKVKVKKLLAFFFIEVKVVNRSFRNHTNKPEGADYM